MSIWTTIKSAAKRVYYKVSGKTYPTLNTGFTPTYSGVPATGGKWPSVVSGTKVTAPTTSTGGGGGIRVVSPTPTTTAVGEPTGFTGKVEEVTPTGEVKGTTFVYGGRRIGTYTTGEDYFTPEADKEEDKKKTYELEFEEEPGIKEKVKISPGEMFWGREEMPIEPGEPLPGIPDVEYEGTGAGVKQFFYDLGAGKYDLKGKYERAEEKVSGFLNIPSIEDIQTHFYSDLSTEDVEFMKGREALIIAEEKTDGIITTQPEFWRGAGTGVYEDIRLHPIKYVGLYAAGAVVGGAAAVVGTIIKTGITTAGLGLTAAYGVGKYGEFQAAGDTFAKGEVIGTAGAEIVTMGAGYGAGVKLGGKISGWWGTRGRDYIPLSELTTADIISGKDIFPTAATYKHLGLFKRSGGAYHTTGQKFWGKDILPSKGTAELPGLYGSAYVSPYFARMGGESGFKFLPSIKDLFIGGKPAVAFLKPLGFREVPVFRISGGKAGSWKFIRAARRGWADIPKMKTEIEAVFRPEAGGYGFESGQFYTKIAGRRVGIDIFKFKKTDLGGVSKPAKGVDLVGGEKTYSLSSLKDYSIMKPQAYGVGASYKKSRTDYRPDYKIPSYKTIYKKDYRPSKISYKTSYRKPSYRFSYKTPSYKSYQPDYYKHSYKMSYKPSYVPPRKSKVMGKLPLFGQLLPQKGVLGTRKFKKTPSLFDVTKFQMGYKVPKRDILGKSGLAGYGVGLRIPKIRMGSLLGSVFKRKTTRKTYKTKRTNKKRRK